MPEKQPHAEVLPEQYRGLSPDQIAELADLSDADRRLLPALALRAGGATWKEAAATIGTTGENLIQAAQRRGWHTAEAAQKRELLAGMSADIAIEAGSQVQGHLANGAYGRNELVTVAGVFADKAGIFRRLELQAAQQASTAGDGVSRILERLADAGGGTLEVKASRTLDVTPEETS